MRPYFFRAFSGFQKCLKKHLKKLYKKYKAISAEFHVTIYAHKFFKMTKNHESIMLRKQNGNKWKQKSINALNAHFLGLLL
jgi:hypothetical protein